MLKLSFSLLLFSIELKLIFLHFWKGFKLRLLMPIILFILLFSKWFFFIVLNDILFILFISFILLFISFCFILFILLVWLMDIVKLFIFIEFPIWDLTLFCWEYFTLCNLFTFLELFLFVLYIILFIILSLYSLFLDRFELSVIIFFAWTISFFSSFNLFFIFNSSKLFSFLFLVFFSIFLS